jgi:hypothetical protein
MLWLPSFATSSPKDLRQDRDHWREVFQQIPATTAIAMPAQPGAQAPPTDSRLAQVWRCGGLAKPNVNWTRSRTIAIVDFRAWLRARLRLDPASATLPSRFPPVAAFPGAWHRLLRSLGDPGSETAGCCPQDGAGRGCGSTLPPMPRVTISACSRLPAAALAPRQRGDDRRQPARSLSE